MGYVKKERSCSCWGGSVDCSNCHGSGYITRTEWNGVDTGRDTCSSCGGSGKVRCSRCGGSGRIYEDEWVSDNDSGSSSSGGSSSSYTPSSSGGGGRSRSLQQMHDYYYKVQKCFNTKKWDELLETYKEACSTEYAKYYQSFTNLAPNVWYMVEVAHANTDPNYDYENAFSGADWGYFANYSGDKKILCQALFDAGKRIYKRKHGREITDAEITRLHINVLENGMAENIKKKYISSAWSKRDEWEQIHGREMTKEEQIRIIGKPFPKRPKDKSSGNDVVPRGKFLSAVFGLVCAFGGALTIGWIYNSITGAAKFPIIPFLILLVVGFIAAFDSWYLKKNKLFLVLLALSVPGWLVMFHILPERINIRQSIKSATTQTQSVTITQQADIINNVNFRKDPSTGDNIIRQLKKGDTVTLTGEVVEGWTQITHNGDTGWVSSEFLKVYGK